MKSNRDTKKSNVCFQGLGVVNEFKYERAWGTSFGEMTRVYSLIVMVATLLHVSFKTHGAELYILFVIKYINKNFSIHKQKFPFKFITKAASENKTFFEHQYN